MPCRDDRDCGNDFAVAYSTTKERLDEVTELLCSLCRSIEESNSTITVNRDLKIWWNNHKEMDKKRIEKENGNAFS